MSARYWVLISDELLAAGLQWPDGLRFVSRPAPPPGGIDVVTGSHELPGMHWHQIEDDSAPPELEDCRVELVFGIADGWPVLAERRAVP